MDNLILNYVSHIVPEQRMKLYLDVNQLLTAFYPDGWPSVMTQIETQIDNATINDIEYMLHGAMNDNLSALIEDCGIVISDKFDAHHNMRQLYHVAHGLFAIEGYPNVVALRARYDAHHSAFDKLAAVLTEVEPGFDAETFGVMVAHISPVKMRVIDEILTDNLSLAEPYLEQHKASLSVQTLLGEYVKDYPALAQLPYQNVTGTIDSYMNFYKETFHTLSVPAAARLAMICVAMTGNVTEDTRSAAAMSLQHIYDRDMATGLRVSRVFMKLPLPTEPSNDQA